MHGTAVAHGAESLCRSTAALLAPPATRSSIRVGSVTQQLHMPMLTPVMPLLTLLPPAPPAVVINFFAPWCHWCQRLSPTWEAATKEVHDKYPEWDGRIRYAKVDCTEEVQLCRDHFITGFPSLRWGHAGCSRAWDVARYR